MLIIITLIKKVIIIIIFIIQVIRRLRDESLFGVVLKLDGLVNFLFTFVTCWNTQWCESVWNKKTNCNRGPGTVQGLCFGARANSISWIGQNWPFTAKLMKSTQRNVLHLNTTCDNVILLSNYLVHGVAVFISQKVHCFVLGFFRLNIKMHFCISA